MRKSDGFTLVETLIGLTILAVLAVGAYTVWQRGDDDTIQLQPAPVDTAESKITLPAVVPSTSLGQEATKDESNFVDPLTGLSFKYPPNYKYDLKVSRTLANHLRYYSLESPCLFPGGDKRCLDIGDADLKLEIYVKQSDSALPLEEQLRLKKDKLIKSQQQADVGSGNDNSKIKLKESTFIVDGIQIFRWEQENSEVLFAERDGYRLEISKFPKQTTRKSEYRRMIDSLKFLPEGQESVNTIREFIDKFEALHQSKNAEAVLSLFTPPTTKQEAEVYRFLAGGDSAAPRLYSTNTSNYKVEGYQVESISETSPGVFIATTHERRANYNNTTGMYSPFTTAHITMKIRLKYGEWLVESFTTQNDERKYSGLSP